MGPPGERRAPFGRVLELETAGPRGRGVWGCGAGHLEGVGGRAGRGRKAAGPRGRLCVLAKWEVMLMTESWGPGQGPGEGARGERLSLKDLCLLVRMLS